jgi:cobalt-zinc-cadmium efflux system membrane fusion protein
MTRSRLSISVFLIIGLPALVVLQGCSKVQANTAGTAPPATKVVADVDLTLFSVEHPERFPLAEATSRQSVSELVATGTVTPDVSRSVPVVSLAAGRVTAIHARLGDAVTAGQVLLSVRSTDVAGAFADYRKAVRDEELAQTQLARAKDLNSHGALALSEVQTAENTATKARVDVETAEEHVRLLGGDPAKPNGIVDVIAPISGVITDQQVTNAAGVQGLGNAVFTISDLSTVWIVCDVFENDLARVKPGDPAEIRLSAYPGKVLHGKVSNIGTVLDPQIRTAKVRIEVPNPGVLRLGLFVTATFRGNAETRTAVPATAIVRLHDRDFVYAPAPDSKFRRLEIVSGELLPEGMQEVRKGLKPGDKVVSNALVLDHAIDR